MLKTRLTEQLGIRHPIMQAGMGGIGPITLATLAAAISEAGGVGMIAHPALLLEKPDLSGDEMLGAIEGVVEQVRSAISATVALTDKPLGINVRIAQEQPDAKAVIEAILEERDRDPKVAEQLVVLSTSGGHPRTYDLNEDIKDSGMTHIHAVSNVRQALVAEGAGMDGVIATGFESAGHVGHDGVHSFVLTPSIAQAVSIPVLAAGGIVDGAALAGALVLGADMAYMGTRFLAAEECEYHENMKDFMIEKDETGSVVVPAFFGPASFLRNEATTRVAELGAAGVPTIERTTVEGKALFKGAIEGDVVGGLMIGGQAVGRVTEVLPAAQIIEQVVLEAEEAIDRLAALKV